jgi:hypothetical protein
MAVTKEQMQIKNMCAPEKPSATYPANLQSWEHSFFWIGACPQSPEAQAVAPCACCGLLPPPASVLRRNEVLRYRIAAVVDNSVAANRASAAPHAHVESPPTVPVRVLSYVRRLMEPLHSEKNSLIPPAGVLAAVFAVAYVAWFLKLERF